MDPLAILYTDFLDLLFENRNKSYGAYPLRKYYPKRFFIAVGIVFGIVLIFASAVILSGNKEFISSRIMYGPDPHLTRVVLEPRVINEPHALKPAAAGKRLAPVSSGPPVIVKDQHIPRPIVTGEELNMAPSGASAEAGPPVTGGPVKQGAASSGGIDSAQARPEILDRAQIMPEFPGGLEALRRFLLRNLRIPDSVTEPGSEVRVLVKFVVGTDGKVTGIQLVQSGGMAFDPEVQRVISRMPVWKPGIQNGRKVSVYYNLPVNFVIPPDN
ncbi:MAG TPA: TonB family protein [Puia sp.]